MKVDEGIDYGLWTFGLILNLRKISFEGWYKDLAKALKEEKRGRYTPPKNKTDRRKRHG